MSPRARKYVLGFIKFSVPLAIVAWLVSRVDAAQWQALEQQPKDIPTLCGAFVLALAAVFLSFLRWAVLVRCQGIPLSVLDTLRLGAIGFLLNFVSAGSVGGDLFKMFFIAQRSPGRRLDAVASVVVDRAIGLYGLVLVVVGVLIVMPPAKASDEFQHVINATAFLAIAGTIALLVLVLGGKQIDSLLRRFPEHRWWGRIVHRVADPIRVFHTHPRALAGAAVMSIAVHSMLALSIYLMAAGLYSDHPSLAEHMIIVPVAMLAAAMPITPAGLGVLEAAMDWLYELIPVVPTSASGTMVALTYEIVRIALAGLGVIFYWTGKRPKPVENPTSTTTP